MSRDVPRVSVGLAVFNGEDYVGEAIDSVLGQTYEDFELVISDNASTDQTEEICRAYAAMDPRVRYFRNDHNIGGANNENRTFLLSRGEYFRWLGHDDRFAAPLLAESVAVLDAEPSVVLCHTQVILIDADGNEIGLLDRNRAASEKARERFCQLTGWDHGCEELYGLIRSDVMHKTRLQPNYTDSDRTLLAQLSLYGRFYQIPKPLFYRRIHQQGSTHVYPEWRERMAWFFPDMSQSKITMPHWSQFLHYLEVISHAPISVSERMGCYSHMVSWLLNKNGRSMAKDLLLATAGILHRPLKAVQRVQRGTNT